jgi:TPR repeat protein
MRKWLSTLVITLFFPLILLASDQHSFWDTYTEALRGDKVAQFQVGVMYERGLEVEKNQTKALQWYEKSAAQGHMDAQYNAAIMYISGRGVEANESVAMMRLAQAAKQGDKDARKLLLILIDDKGERKEKISPQVNPETQNGMKIESTAITPVTLVCKENATVCSGYGNSGTCTLYRVRTVLTSNEKKENFYKITGTATKQGWMAFKKEGWIEENSVEIRR